MTWIGAWTIRGVVVFVGIFAAMLALDLLGLNKADNPFTSWAGFVQVVALSIAVCILLAIEAIVQHEGWPITRPTVTFGSRQDGESQ